jgi:branched-chain amino acid transport system permease protein
VNAAQRTYGQLLIVVVGAGIAIAFAWRSPALLDTLLVIGTTAVLACSLGLVYGQAGMLSLAQAAFATIGAYASALLTLRLGLSPWLGLVAAIAVPALLAYLLARTVVRLSPLALGIATLLVGEIVVFAISAGGPFTGGFIGLTGIRPAPLLESRQAQVIAAWVVVVVCILILMLISRSQAGRALRVISRDQVLARSLGIDVAARLSAIFALGGAMAGTAGWLYAHSRSFLAPTSLPVLLSLEVLMMVILGGRRAYLGPLMGVVLLTVVVDLLPGVELGAVFYGVALIAALLVIPEGILGTNWASIGRRLRSLLRPRRDPVPATREVPE